MILAAKSGAGSGHQARRTGMSASEIFSLKQSTYETADGLCLYPAAGGFMEATVLKKNRRLPQSLSLIDWDTGKKVLLGRHPMSRYAEALSTKTPIAFKSRDGLMLHGYLTLPKGKLCNAANCRVVF